MKKITLLICCAVFIVVLAGCAVRAEIQETGVQENVMGEMEQIIETGYHRVFYFYDTNHVNECYIYYQPTDSVGSISCIKK